MRSSSEWNATTTRRPPGASTASAAASACRQLVELVVDEDAQRLKRARRGMDGAAAGGRTRPTIVGELARGA